MQRDEQGKAEILQANGTFNTRAEKVVDTLFAERDFFDARDLVQVKYEMLRRVREDGVSVARAAADFGFSRVTYYEVQRAWEHGGIAGLFPQRRGPKHAHKLTGDVMEFVRAALAEDPALGASEAAALIHKRFGMSVHPRSIERALARPVKKGL